MHNHRSQCLCAIVHAVIMLVVAPVILACAPAYAQAEFTVFRNLKLGCQVNSVDISRDNRLAAAYGAEDEVLRIWKVGQ